MTVYVEPATDEPLVVSPRRACRLLDIGHSRLWELIKDGELESFKDGTAHNSPRKITMASLKAYVSRKLSTGRAA